MTVIVIYHDSYSYIPCFCLSLVTKALTWSWPRSWWRWGAPCPSCAAPACPGAPPSGSPRARRSSRACRAASRRSRSGHRPRTAAEGGGGGVSKCWGIETITIDGSRWHGRPVGVMVSCLRFFMNSKNIQTNNLIITREAGWRYGIISTVPTAKNIQTNNLILENILSFHQFNRPPVSSWTVNCFDVYGWGTTVVVSSELCYSQIF